MSIKCASFPLALGLLASGLATIPAIAATPTASFGVTAMVQAGCLVSASAVRFGVHAGEVMDATSLVSVACTHSIPYSFGLTAGPAPDATLTSPTKTGPRSALLSFAALSGSEGDVNWGQIIDSDTFAPTGNGSLQTVAVHSSRISTGHFTAAIADTITVTVIY